MESPSRRNSNMSVPPAPGSPLKQHSISSLNTNSNTNTNTNDSKKYSNSSNSTVGSTAATALSYLLREDPLLSELRLTTLSTNTTTNTNTNTNNSDEDLIQDSKEEGEEGPIDNDNSTAAFSYAAALINAESSWLNNNNNNYNNNNNNNNENIQQKANEALIEVEQKLALVESLAERISREKPEHVAGPLLKLHGHDVRTVSFDDTNDTNDTNNAKANDAKANDTTNDNNNNNNGATLTATREQCERLRRQSHVLDSVAKRVESTLLRGLDRMDAATTKLERVLWTGQVLKMVMRLQFEAKKVMGGGFRFDGLKDGVGVGVGVGVDDGLSRAVDLRDLTRVASSVAIVEDLLDHEDLKNREIQFVEKLRPEAERVGREVRAVAATLLEGAFGIIHGDNDNDNTRNDNDGNATNTIHNNYNNVHKNMPSATTLGATLQVYYHLKELPDAVWRAVGLGLERAEKASGQFLNPTAIRRLHETAKKEAKLISERDPQSSNASNTTTAAGAGGSMTSNAERKRRTEALYERTLKKKMREKRREAATKWASGIMESSLQIWNLHRVLSRKTDPVTRESFWEVVHRADVPDAFSKANELSSSLKNNNNNNNNRKKNKNSIFALFWNQMCISLGSRIQKLLIYEQGKLAEDVATLYPAARAAALDVITSIQDTMHAGNIDGPMAFLDDWTSGGAGGGGVGVGTFGGHNSTNGTSAAGGGILGGSSGLDNAVLFGLMGKNHHYGTDGDGGTYTVGALNGLLSSSELDAAADMDHAATVSADSWTKSEVNNNNNSSSSSTNINNVKSTFASRSTMTSHTTTGMSSILSSPEWLALQGFGETGLYPMQKTFLGDVDERLGLPLKSLFMENSVVDEHGISVSVLPSLPTQKDLKSLETTIRNELASADPREGGGESSMATMISENVVDMVEQFCRMARNATSRTAEEKLFEGKNGKPTEGLLHDMKVAEVMSLMATILRRLPENTFVVPYRPAHSTQHEEAANMCQIALLPALHEVESFVKDEILDPLCRVLNARISTAVAKMHLGTYIESVTDVHGSGSFVRDHLIDMYDDITDNVLSRLPTEYASIVATRMTTYSIYCFISNATLVRPLGEGGRLRITQDLADFELTLDQMLSRVGCSTSLNQIDDGRPYAELRAVRQMLFWNGLDENKSLSAELVAKVFLRETWVRDVRSSTAFHFLFSLAPKLLSSPHHSCRMSAEEYVKTLVRFDGSLDDGESKSWITTMACCDAYQQRESIDGSNVGGGDKRIAAILMIIGPEILRRRRH